MQGYVLVERKGDVEFYEDSKGRLYQKIGSSDIMKVKDGKMAFSIMGKVNGYTIKYNKNGVTGFSIWKGSVCLEDNFWNYNDVLQVAYEM
mgnify:CR=1 FL=1